LVTHCIYKLLCQKNNNKADYLAHSVALKAVDIGYCRDVIFALLCSLALLFTADSFSATIYIKTADKISIAHPWAFSTSDNMRWSQPSFDDST
jgi:hypothetical protein